MKISLIATLVWGFLAVAPSAFAGDVAPNIAAALIMKVAAFEQSIAASDSISFYVLGDKPLQEELEKLVGNTSTSLTLTKVSGGTDLPQIAPSVLIVGKQADSTEVQAFLATNQILAVTRINSQFEELVPVELLLNSSGKPEVHVWQKLSSKLLLHWDPMFLKAAVIH